MDEMNVPVELYIYDLSQGMAKQMSRQFLGKQIDGVWHASIVVYGMEFYYGQGIQTSAPGSTHHGRPLEIINMGNTSLPQDIFIEFLDSLKSTYTTASYDLFEKNCLNFTNDVAQFLVGREIPDRISGLPREVLSTPLGQILRPMLDQSLRPIVQAPTVPPPPKTAQAQSSNVNGNHHMDGGKTSQNSFVINLSTMSDLKATLKSSRCTVIFFTSATCGPCRMIYPDFDSLSLDMSNCKFVKVDIGKSSDCASHFRITATPTFMTFINENRLDEWKGADIATLRRNLNTLQTVAHPHYMKYSKLPLMEKLLSKIKSKDPIFREVAVFVESKDLQSLPNMSHLATILLDCIENYQPLELFPVVDLLRLLVQNPRASALILEAPQNLVGALFTNLLSSNVNRPFQLSLVTLQALCNLFSTPLFPPILCTDLASEAVHLMTRELASSNESVRLAATSLAFNISSYLKYEPNPRQKLDGPRLDLFAALLYAVEQEIQSTEVLKGQIYALAMLYYCTDDNEIIELVNVLGAVEMLKAKTQLAVVKDSKNGITGMCKELILLFES